MSALAEKQHLVKKVAARKSGTAITFTKQVEGTYDPATNTFSGDSVTTVTGYASRVRGDPERYRALELIESEAPTLEFTPDTFNELPSLGATCAFGGVTYAVRDIAPWSPDGNAISATIVVAR